MADPVKPAANDPGTAPPPLPIFYKDPQPLVPQVFGKHGFKGPPSYKFTLGTNSVPLMITEFQHAQKTHPIIFAGDPPMPIAVLGFANAENLFVAADGKWADDTYLPSYIRRYPFVLAEVKDDDRMYLCIDAKADMIVDKNVEAPFFVNDQPTDIVNQAMEFCRLFQDDLQRTRVFCSDLQTHGLLRSMDVQYLAQGGRQQANVTVTTIDMEKLDALPEATFLEFRKKGYLPAIYFQLTSLLNWTRLNQRRERIFAEKLPKP